MSARRWGFAAAGLVVALYLATGVAVVQQDEVGVVRRFGAVTAEPWAPGLHWGLPWGLGRIDRVSIDQARHDHRRCARVAVRPLRARARPRV